MTTFQSNIIRIYREKPKYSSSRLDLRDLKEVTNLTYNYVLSGFQADNPIILKLGLDHEALTREALAKAGRMLLIERAVLGISLKNYFPDRERESI
ncbi:MAG: hypothetical protein KA998_02055 [Rickettsiaceae bacterium]|nr:hypothetical protein [Rickettsiaceae bacterium]